MTYTKQFPAFDELSADLRYKLWKKDRRAHKLLWTFTVLVCLPGVLFVTVKPVNDAVSIVSNALVTVGAINKFFQPPVKSEEVANKTDTQDDPKVLAYLDVIAWAEGTGDNYNTAVGYTDAPLWTYNAELDSDAWGRYQYLSTTAQPILAKLGYTADQFTDPKVQDQVMIEHLKELGIYEVIVAGDIDTALNMAGTSQQWASMPGSTAGQNPKDLATVRKIYDEKLAARQGQTTAQSTEAVAVASTGLGSAVEWNIGAAHNQDKITQALVTSLSKIVGLESIPEKAATPGTPAQTVTKYFPIQGQDLETAAKTSDYGNRTHPIYGDQRFHAGIDFGADAGTPLVSTEAAVVTEAITEDTNGCGLSVAYKLTSGNEVRYCHMESVTVNVGDSLVAGQIVGTVGSTGGSTGAHLHVEYYVGGETVDPSDYIASLTAPPTEAASTTTEAPAVTGGLQFAINYDPAVPDTHKKQVEAATQYISSIIETNQTITLKVTMIDDKKFIAAAKPTAYNDAGLAIEGEVRLSTQHEQTQVAVRHELLHVLGIGSAPNWFAAVDRATNTYKADTLAGVAYGGKPIPLATDNAHWSEDINDKEMMTEFLTDGTGDTISELDKAALRDIGWKVK